MPDALAPPPQNIYDDPDFFAGYSCLERFGEEGLPEERWLGRMPRAA